MEDEELESQGGSGMIPIALAVLGIVLGGAGLYFGMTANQRLTPIAESVESGSSGAERLKKAIGALETRLTELSAKLDDLKGAFDRSRVYANQSETAIQSLASELNDNRDRINEIGKRLNELASASAQAPAPAPATPSNATERAPSAGGGDVARGGSGGGATYRIQSGDTFAKIASEQGVSLQALLDANPETDPRRLRIGQQIVIPAN